jgi:hypothetical protein
VDTGFPPARSLGKGVGGGLTLRRAKAGRKKIMLKKQPEAKQRFKLKLFRF